MEPTDVWDVRGVGKIFGSFNILELIVQSTMSPQTQACLTTSFCMIAKGQGCEAAGVTAHTSP